MSLQKIKSSIDNIVEYYELVWELDEWQSKLSRQTVVVSNSFYLKDFSLRWVKLKLYTINSDLIHIEIYYGDVKGTKEFSFNFSLLDKHQKLISTDRFVSIINDDHFQKQVLFIDKNNVEENVLRHLEKSKIHILCELTLKKMCILYKKPENYSEKFCELEPCENLDLTVKSDKFELLLENKTFSDVYFKINNEQIYSHKIILANKSPVFAAMFEHDMKELKENKVVITDVTYDIFKEMLRFIYTGKVNDIDKVAEELIFAADKYCIEDLKNDCEVSLSKRITLKNFISYIDVAVFCNTNCLKNKLLEFIVSNKKLVTKIQLKMLCKKYPDFMSDLLEEMAN